MKKIFGTKENMGELYDCMTQVPEFMATSEITHEMILDFFKSFPKGASLLDVGPGKGKESRLAVDLGLKITGVDISPKMLEVFKEEVPEADAVVGTAVQLPQGDAVFDGVFASNCILHLDRPDGIRAISEFFRVLKNKGRLFLSTSVGDGREELNERPWLKQAGIECWYFYHWKKEDLRNQLEKAGLTLEQWQEKQIVENRPSVAFIVARK